MGFFNNSDEDQKYSMKQVEDDSKAGALSHGTLDINDLNREIASSISSVFNASGIQSLWDELRPNDRLEQFGNFRRGRGGSGLKAYPVPTLSSYANCIKNDGLSVFDENGWWRCLFPRNKVGNSNELTREDVEQDATNKHGLFFKEFNGYMDWRLKVKMLMREKQESERKAAWEAREAANIQGIYDDYTKDTDYHDAVVPESDPVVVNHQKIVKYKTLPNGDGEETTYCKKIFADGTAKEENFKKTFPKDGGLPIVEEVSPQEKKRSGWIWDQK